MGKKQDVKAEVEFEGKGLGKLRGQWLDFAGDLAEPLILLSAGATKMQAAWAGARSVFMTRVLGPMGMVAGATVGLVALTSKLISRWKKVGVESASALENMETQFKPVLGSAQLAKKRVQELYEFTANTPFSLDDVAKGNKTLEKLTQGALSGEKGMLLVSDSAAVANESFAATSRSVGRVYDGLMNGRPVGEASMRLQELGLITGKTRNAIESMQKANESGSSVWAVVERDLAKNKGAAADLSKDLDGLKETLADAEVLMSAGFGKGFMDGEKASVQASIKVMEMLTPVAESVGEKVGWLSNKWAVFKARIVEGAASIPGASKVLSVLAGVFGVLTSAVLLATGIALGKFLWSVVAVTKASRAQVTAMGADAAVKGVNTVVTTKLALAQGHLASAYAQVRSGSLLAAAGHVKQAAAATLSSFRTNALATSTMLLSKVLKGVIVVTKFVVAQLRMMAVALLSNPMFLFAAAIGAVVSALVYFSSEAKKAEAALRNYQQAVDDLTHSLELQRDSLETLADLRKHEADVIKNLGEAQREEAEARRSENAAMIEAAQRKVAMLKQELEVTNAVSRSVLRMTEAEAAREQRDFDDKKGIKGLKDDALLNGSSNEHKAKVMEARAEEAARKFKAAQADVAEEERVKDATDRASQGDMLSKEKLAGKRGDLSRVQAVVGEMREAGMLAKDDQELAPNDRKFRAKMLREEKQLLKEIAELSVKTGVGSEAAIGLESKSEIVRLRSKVSLYNKLKKHVEDVKELRKAIADLEKNGDRGDAEDEDLKKKRLALKEELAMLKVVQAENEKHAGFSGAGEEEAGKLKLKRLEKERLDDGSKKKLAEKEMAAAAARKDYEDYIANRKLDVAQRLAEYGLEGVAQQRKGLELERERLVLARSQRKIGREEYQMEMDLLRAKARKLGKDASEKAAEMRAGFDARQLDRKAVDARRNGRQGEAEDLRAQAEALRAGLREKALRKEAAAVTDNVKAIDAYVARVLAEEKAVRAGEKTRKDAEESRKRARVRLQSESLGGLEDGFLRSKGKSAAADAREEARQRKLDELKRVELTEKFKGQGFGAKEADELANREVKVSQGQRLISRLREQSGSDIVATSLAKIGGGGAVVGRDNSEKLLERIEVVLKEIRDKEAREVTLR